MSASRVLLLVPGSFRLRRIPLIGLSHAALRARMRRGNDGLGGGDAGGGMRWQDHNIHFAAHQAQMTAAAGTGGGG